MNTLEKKIVLESKIHDSLQPLIQSDYWLLEVPHYSNVGDTLIWQGELDFLKQVKYRCRGMRAYDSCALPKIRKSDMVLFQGGGNFGDIWEEPQNYRKRIMERFPDSKYLIFPQTVWYEEVENLKKDATFFAKYDCTICARDNVSYQTLHKYFKNKILLVPDMAFCIDISKWRHCFTNETTQDLVLKRSDKEFKSSIALETILQLPDIAVADWSTMEGDNQVEYVRWQVRRVANKFRQGWMYDMYMKYIYRPYLIRSGIKQLSSFNKIYTTRLHACILSILLNKKEVVFFDNSYGKNRTFYETWLKDCENLTMEQ